MRSAIIVLLVLISNVCFALGQYGEPDGLKRKYIAEVVNKLPNKKSFDSKKLDEVIQKFNQKVNSLSNNSDPVDEFLKLLPKTYLSHFTMAHRSYSIQQATPLAPRAIVFGTDASVIMSFNGGVDENGKKQKGGNSIEILEWKDNEKNWQLAEIQFNGKSQVKKEINPEKCMMCHSGTPKVIKGSEAKFYKPYVKPIFAQYPLWPGMYGSINDIVGIEHPNSKDTIMRSFDATLDHIKSLTFEHTEELARLRNLLDTNDKYVQVVRDEYDIHRKHFANFMSSRKSKSRYKRLVTFDDFYTDKGQSVPRYLRSAPFRRTFSKAYGNYLLRPNFYFSSLLTFRHSQYVAKQIESFPQYDRMKYSFLTRKLNCGKVSSGRLSNEDLDDSYDLMYPNVATKETMDKQFLLAYQYNIVQSQKEGGQPHLPLHAWNMEPNEQITSYHYGNVYADLNELVLWRLASNAHPSIKHSSGRDATDQKHVDLLGNTFLRDKLREAGGRISRFTQSQLDFSNQINTYYGNPEAKYQRQPISSKCNLLKVAAREELQELSNVEMLPHEIYTLDPELTNIDGIVGQEDIGTNIARQACLACHKPYENKKTQVGPKINIDWWDENYHTDLKKQHTSVTNPNKMQLPLHAHINIAMAGETLPVPFGNQMPFGRKPMENFALKCEQLIIKNYLDLNRSLKGEVYQCDPKKDANSFACRCAQLDQKRWNLYQKHYKIAD